MEGSFAVSGSNRPGAAAPMSCSQFMERSSLLARGGKESGDGEQPPGHHPDEAAGQLLAAIVQDARLGSDKHPVDRQRGGLEDARAVGHMKRSQARFHE